MKLNRPKGIQPRVVVVVADDRNGARGLSDLALYSTLDTKNASLLVCFLACFLAS
jgi:hypothetical protein